MEMITLSVATAAVFAVVSLIVAHAIVRIETGLSFAENAKQPAQAYRYYDGDLQCYVTSEKHIDACNNAICGGIGFGFLAASAVFFGGLIGFAAVAASMTILVVCAARKVKLATI